MKFNIQNDLDSREKISAIESKKPLSVEEPIVINQPIENYGTTTEISQRPDNKAGLYKKQKKGGRKAGRNA